MVYTKVNNADKGIVARATINSNFEKLFNTGLFYGELNSTITPTINTTDTKVNLIDTIVVQTADIFAFDNVNKKLKVKTSGVYCFTGNCNVETSNANQRLEFTLYKNGVATNIKSFKMTSGSGKTDHITYSGYINLVANDEIDFYIKSDATTTLTVYTANIGLEKSVY